MEPWRILIVDDEPQVLKLFKLILSREGYSVSAVTSGQQVVDFLRHDHVVDLLILDLSMPEPDGFEMLKLLRATRPALKILVVSGFIEGALLRAAQLCGATATLSKTEAPQRLLETVKSLLPG